MQDLASDIENWINSDLSKPLAVFNNLPACPYAKKAWMDKRVQVKQIVGLDVFNYMEQDSWTWSGKRDVIVYGMKPDAVSSHQLSTLVEQANSTFLKDRGFVALEDHPDDLEQIQDVCLNQGTWALVLLQKRSKLDEARQYLASKNYYKNWPEKYRSEVQDR